MRECTQSAVDCGGAVVMRVEAHPEGVAEKRALGAGRAEAIGISPLGGNGHLCELGGVLVDELPDLVEEIGAVVHGNLGPLRGTKESRRWVSRAVARVGGKPSRGASGSLVRQLTCTWSAIIQNISLECLYLVLCGVKSLQGAVHFRVRARGVFPF